MIVIPVRSLRMCTWTSNGVEELDLAAEPEARLVQLVVLVKLLLVIILNIGIQELEGR